MLRKLTILASILFVGNLSAASVPIAVPQAIQNAYVITDTNMKHVYVDETGKRHFPVDSGTLYAIQNSDLNSRTQPPIEINVVSNGTLLPYHHRVADYIFGIFRGKKIKQGDLYFLSKISADRNGLVFTFESLNFGGDYIFTADTGYTAYRRYRMEIRFAMTPAELAAITPAAMKQMTDKFFTVSPDRPTP